MRQAIAIFIVLVTVALTAFLVTHKLSNPDHYAYGYCPPRVCTSFREADAGTRTPDPIITSEVATGVNRRERAWLTRMAASRTALQSRSAPSGT